MSARRKRLSPLASIFIGSLLSVFAQAQGQNPRPKPGDEDLVRQRQQTRLLNIVRVGKFAERALGFKDLGAKAITVSRLADLLWDDDEAYARQLFSKALDACVIEKESGKASDTKLMSRGIASVRRQVIGYISRRDAKWAKQLIDSGPFSEGDALSGSQANIETAYDLALNNEAKSAADFAQRSLKGGVSPWIVGLLIELRRNDQTLSDSLFVQVLERLGSDTTVDLNTFLYLGTYLFTSPRANPDDPTASAQVVVGRNLVYDITLDRPNVPPGLARAYIQTAITLIARSNSESQSSLSYVVGYLLLPKAQRFAPELVPILSSTMQAIASKVPRELLESAAYKNLEPSPSRALDDTLSDIEKLSSESLRDEKYFSLVAALWQKKQYASARSVTRRLSDSNVRQRIETVIDFAEAADSLTKTDMLRAYRIAEKMPRGIERSIIWLAIAHAKLAAKETSEAAAATTHAVDAVASVVDARRGSILLEGAGLTARLNTGNAITLLHEAIKEFNSQSPQAFKRIEWRQKIEVGQANRVFSLKIKGFDGDFSQAAASLASFDAESLISELDTLSPEEPRSKLMFAVAVALLKPEPH